jgi:hypothetical protein
VHARAPRGFVHTTVYHPVTPLETRYQTLYYAPSGHVGGLDVLSVVLYRLPPSHVATTAAQQVRAVRGYDRRVGARVLDGPTRSSIDGRTAWEETAIEQGTYRYVAFYVFASHHLAVIACQVDQHPKLIASGCGQLVESIIFT